MMQINLVQEMFDAAISIAGKYGRWLNLKKNKYCFLIWTGCVAYWTYRNYQIGLISQTLFAAVSIGFNLYGFFKWRKQDGL